MDNGAVPTQPPGPSDRLSSAGTHLIQAEDAVKKIAARLYGAEPDKGAEAQRIPESLLEMGVDLQRRAASLNETLHYILERL